MSKQKNKTGKARAGRGETAGAGFRPADLPEQASQIPTPDAGEVPLGLPISAEEYQKLQEQSRHKTLPPTGFAQEDSSG
jgi:hypothetical protein